MPIYVPPLPIPFSSTESLPRDGAKMENDVYGMAMVVYEVRPY
jgi:hypothetical protein